MHETTITIPDDAYLEARQRAEQEGFGSTESFLSDLLVSSISGGSDNFGHFCTPQVIAEIDAAAIEARTGDNLTPAQMKMRLKARRATQRLIGA
jgi:hypothetical protein